MDSKGPQPSFAPAGEKVADRPDEGARCAFDKLKGPAIAKSPHPNPLPQQGRGDNRNRPSPPRGRRDKHKSDRQLAFPVTLPEELAADFRHRTEQQAVIRSASNHSPA